MINHIYDAAADNAAYMQGFVAGRRATGEDWVTVRLELDDERAKKQEAWANEIRIADAAQRRIRELEVENEALRSRLRAYQVSMQALVQEELRV